MSRPRKCIAGLIEDIVRHKKDDRPAYTDICLVGMPGSWFVLDGFNKTLSVGDLVVLRQLPNKCPCGLEKCACTCWELLNKDV